jgi:hypothetical protein
MMDKPTIEQVKAEPAGAQIDAWVAKFVLEWELIDTPDSTWFEKSKWENIDHDVYCIYESFTGRREIIHAYKNGYSRFKPSQDIAAAWQVVEKFQQFDFQMDASDSFFVAFQVAGQGWSKTVHADTAPLAICRAALMAKLCTQSTS